MVVENIVSRRDAGEPRIEAVRKVPHKIARPLIDSTVTPVVVFLPLIAVTGVTGSFRALAITMAVVLLTSLVLAVSFTPGLTLLLLGERKGEAAHDAEPHANGVLGRILAGTSRLLTGRFRGSFGSVFFAGCWWPEPTWIPVAGV